jgi:hypothetical protein
MGSASSFRSSGIQLLSGLFLLTLSSCFPCADMDCGNGVCSQGVCECYDGYYGSECQYATGGAGYDCNSGTCSYVSANADYATISECENACGSSCNYNVYSGGGSCSDPANFPVSASLCCSPSYPFYCSETGMCYTSCTAADAACSSATVVTGSTSGGGAGYDCISGSCTYVSANGDYATLSACQSACAPSCSYSVFNGGGTCNDPANFPVSTTWCCSSTYPYYCPETGLCYTTCAAADAACSSAGVVTGSGSGGSAGYNCSGGNCSYVSSGAAYSSQSACENACGGSGPATGRISVKIYTQPTGSCQANGIDHTLRFFYYCAQGTSLNSVAAGIWTNGTDGGGDYIVCLFGNETAALCVHGSTLYNRVYRLEWEVTPDDLSYPTSCILSGATNIDFQDQIKNVVIDWN